MYIPKPDGRQRPLGITTLEDKVVQRALVLVLNCIYETDFLGFSSGFRPGRNQHDALDALYVGIKRVNWVLDADIRGYFDAISHEWLVKFVEHRIADRRVARLIQKWLTAGVLEDGEKTRSEMGTPQGGGISPLLANVYLHYVFDPWVRDWRRRAKGDVIVVRYADDCAPRRRRREVFDRTDVPAAQEMRDGPSGSDGRVRVQTTGSCFGTMAGVVSVSGKGGTKPVRCVLEDERE